MASNITTLAEKAKQGDADAFSTLYQMYYPKMKGKCLLEDINRFAEANFAHICHSFTCCRTPYTSCY